MEELFEPVYRFGTKLFSLQKNIKLAKVNFTVEQLYMYYFSRAKSHTSVSVISRQKHQASHPFLSFHSLIRDSQVPSNINPGRRFLFGVVDL